MYSVYSVYKASACIFDYISFPNTRHFNTFLSHTIHTTSFMSHTTFTRPKFTFPLTLPLPLSQIIPPSSPIQLDAITFVLTLCFLLELIIRLLGNGIVSYFSDNFNCFDFLIVLVSHTHCTHYRHYTLFTHYTHTIHTLYTHYTHTIHTLYTLHTYNRCQANAPWTQRAQQIMAGQQVDGTGVQIIAHDSQHIVTEVGPTTRLHNM